MHNPMKTTRYFCFFLWLLMSFLAQAQPAQSYVEVLVAPTDPDWTYATGDKIDFQVSILRAGHPIPGASIRYEIGPEQMPAELTGTETLKSGITVLRGGTMKSAGFLRCQVWAEVDGKTYRGAGTAGVSPAKIEPVAKLPADFTAFWDSAKAQLAQLPLDARMTLLPERGTDKTDVYHVNLQNFGASRLYGILCVPKAAGSYPALLSVPGAGARPYYGDVSRADQGLITFTIGIHGLPVTLENQVYQDLMRGAFAGYWINKLDDRDAYYFKRVYLGCVRSVDFIFSLPQFDGKNVAVTGGSQGGALSIVTAGLDPRITSLAAFYPALCDLTGYLEGRAGGWPHMFKNFDADMHPRWAEVAAYYDVVNFARQVKAPGWYSWGYNDNVCPPTSMYAAYNAITAAKELHLALETAHWTFPEQGEWATAWLMKQLGKE